MDRRAWRSCDRMLARRAAHSESFDGRELEGHVSEPYVAGAYLLVKPGPLIGAGGLTASACLAEMAPDSWAIEWANVEPADRERQAVAARHTCRRHPLK